MPLFLKKSGIIEKRGMLIKGTEDLRIQKTVVAIGKALSASYFSYKVVDEWNIGNRFQYFFRSLFFFLFAFILPPFFILP